MQRTRLHPHRRTHPGRGTGVRRRTHPRSRTGPDPDGSGHDQPDRLPLRCGTVLSDPHTGRHDRIRGRRARDRGGPGHRHRPRRPTRRPARHLPPRHLVDPHRRVGDRPDRRPRRRRRPTAGHAGHQPDDRAATAARPRRPRGSPPLGRTNRGQLRGGGVPGQTRQPPRAPHPERRAARRLPPTT